MIYLSVVTGTYNRLDYLRRMIDSARAATLPAIGLEFVIVDGGSWDGTLDYCRAQPDVVLIEHGELRGAIAAFNDGARAASGRYVVLANDDIEFLPDALTRAVVYMDDHADTGIGAFFQDRAGRGWHVEPMPAIDPAGRQTSVAYGQVCIVPRWLGDALGWWGDFGARTYGGDTMLSAKAWESGWPIEPLEDSRIHDLTPLDDLRTINNARELGDGEHPDTAAYLAVYPRGPRIASKRLERPLDWPAAALRIFYAPIYEEGQVVQRQQKRGLRLALENAGLLVHEFDYVGIASDVGETEVYRRLVTEAALFRPDLFLFQVHHPGSGINGDRVRGLIHRHPDALFVNWNGDYWPKNLTSPEGLDLASAFDVQLVVNSSVIPELHEKGIGAAHWDIAFEPLILPPADWTPADPAFDVIFLGNAYSDQRHRLGDVLLGLDADVRLYGSGWPNGASNTTYDFRQTGDLIRQARVVIGDSQWPDATGFVSDRLVNSLAAGGAVLLHQWFDGIEDLGLIDGENCVIWQGLEDLPELVAYWCNPRREKRRRAIAQAGQALALARHSFDCRVRELFLDLLERGINHVIA